MMYFLIWQNWDIFIDAVGSYQRILNKEDEKYLMYCINQNKLDFAVLKKKKNPKISVT